MSDAWSRFLKLKSWLFDGLATYGDSCVSARLFNRTIANAGVTHCRFSDTRRETWHQKERAKVTAGAPVKRVAYGDTPANDGSGTQASSSGSTPASVPTGGKIVQMSDKWVYQNLPAAVGRELAETIRDDGYARHILYVPFYLPSAIEHVAALLEGREHDHGNHHLSLHYTEAEVAKAVEEKQARLDKKFGRT